MKQIVEEVLEALSNEKKEQKRFPEYVIDVELKKEIWKRINAAIHELRKEGKLRTGNTLNRKFIELLPIDKKEQ